MEENISQKEKEKAEEEMIEQAFQELLNDYLATKHRKRVEIITKAFNFANQVHDVGLAGTTLDALMRLVGKDCL